MLFTMIMEKRISDAMNRYDSDQYILVSTLYWQIPVKSIVVGYKRYKRLIYHVTKTSLFDKGHLTKNIKKYKIYVSYAT